MTETITREHFRQIVAEAIIEGDLDMKRAVALGRVCDKTDACLVGEYVAGDDTLNQCPAAQTGMLRDGGFLWFAMRFDRLVRVLYGDDVRHLRIVD